MYGTTPVNLTGEKINVYAEDGLLSYTLPVSSETARVEERVDAIPKSYRIMDGERVFHVHLSHPPTKILNLPAPSSPVLYVTTKDVAVLAAHQGRTDVFYPDYEKGAVKDKKTQAVIGTTRFLLQTKK